MSSSNHPKPESGHSPEKSTATPESPVSTITKIRASLMGGLTHENVKGMLEHSANVAITASAASLAVASIKLPMEHIFDKLLIKGIKIKGSDVKQAGLYSSIGLLMRMGLPRACYAIHSKQHDVPEKITIQEPTPLAQKMTDLSLLAGFETAVTHIPDQIVSLETQKKIFHNNVKNFAALTQAGILVRFSASAINLGCFTHLQEILLKSISQSNQPSYTENTAAGALSGLAAGLVSYPLKEFQNKICESAVIDKGKLTYPHTRALFMQSAHELHKKTFAEICRTNAPKVLIRSLQSSLLFSVVSGINYALPNPASTIFEYVSDLTKKPR